MLENITLFVAGLLCVATVWNLWFSITPPKWLIWILQMSVFRFHIPEYKSYQDWEVYAALKLKLLGRLLTCPKCLSFHISFWGALYLQIFYEGSITSRCGFFLTCALGWVALMNRFLAPKPALVGEKVIETDKKEYPKPNYPDNPLTSASTPQLRKASAPDSVETRVAFLKSRGADVEVLEGNRILVKKIEPVHQKLQNLVKLDGSQDCFFPGCDGFLQPLRDKKQDVENHQCPSCELGPVIEEVYQGMVKHIRESGLYDELNQ